MKIPSRGSDLGTGSESLVGIDHTVVRARSGVTTWSPAHPSVQEAVEPMRSLKVQKAGRSPEAQAEELANQPGGKTIVIGWRRHPGWGGGVLVVSTGVGASWDALATQFIMALVRN